MPYNATPAEWLALGAIAQQPGHVLRSHPLRVFLKEYVGVNRPMPFIHSLIRGGLIELAPKGDYYTLTEWGATARRARVETRLPWFIEVPQAVLEAKQRQRH